MGRRKNATENFVDCTIFFDRKQFFDRKKNLTIKKFRLKKKCDEKKFQRKTKISTENKNFDREKQCRPRNMSPLKG